jgi:hypothetical protein
MGPDGKIKYYIHCCGGSSGPSDLQKCESICSNMENKMKYCKNDNNPDPSCKGVKPPKNGGKCIDSDGQTNYFIQCCPLGVDC